MKNVFDRWVSLGNYCLTRFQINRHIAYHSLGFRDNSAEKIFDHFYGSSKPLMSTLNGGGYFFDWVIVGNYNKIIELFGNGFDYRLDRGCLKEIRNARGDIKSIVCKKTQIQWFHLFPRDRSRGNIVSENWGDYFDDCSAKVEHLRDKFLSLRSYKTLYVLTLNRSALDIDLPKRLYEALRKLRGNDLFALLVAIPISESPLPKDFEGIYYRSYDPIPGNPLKPWLGNSRSWDKVLSDFSLFMPKAKFPPMSLPPLQDTILQQMEGYVDGIQHGHLVGWVINKAIPNYALIVELWDGEQMIASAVANRYREDVENYRPGTGESGFEIPLSYDLLDGRMHQLHVRVAGAQYELNKSPLLFGPANDLVWKIVQMQKEIEDLREQISRLSPKA